MKKVLSFTLVSLALAALASPAQAQFGGSVRGDVGMLGNQVPYLTVTTGIAPVSDSVSYTYLSDRKEGDWDFTGRLFVYTSCAPCATYIAGSWQGSNHTVNSSEVVTPTVDLLALLPIRIGLVDALIDIPVGNPVAADIQVRNKFSKAKLGMGFELIKTCCFSFTMEVGGNYLNAELNTDRATGITLVELPVTPLALPLPSITLGLGNLLNLDLPGLAALLPFDYLINEETTQKTEGVGLYASFKAEYKFPASCFGNCFSIYGKAEVADIIGRQSYNSRVHYDDIIAVEPLDILEYNYYNELENRYNNIVEVDLEAALVYAPCFRCFDNLNLNFALGVRTDSFVNLFSTPTSLTSQSFLSLTRPTVFLEVGIKV